MQHHIIKILQSFEKKEDRNVIQCILIYIAVSRNGLSRQEIIDILEKKLPECIDENNILNSIQVLLTQLHPYFLEKEGLINFEQDSTNVVNQYYLKNEYLLQQVHKELGLYFFGLGPQSSRMMSETPYHLGKARMWNELTDLLTDLVFITAKCKAGLISDLVTDYKNTLEVLPESREEKRKKAEYDKKIQSYITELIAYAEQQTSAYFNNKKNINHLKKSFDTGKKISFPEIPTSIKSWTPEDQKKEINRISKDPTRLDILCSFAEFIKTEQEYLNQCAQYDGFCIQHAWNYISLGPVAASAKKAVQDHPDTVMLLRQPDQLTINRLRPALQKSISGHTKIIENVDVTPDGKRAISASSDKTLRFWDLENNVCLSLLKGHQNTVKSVRMTPDARIAVSGGYDNTVRVWNLNEGKCTSILEGHVNTISCVDITPDGKIAISSSRDQTLRLWDLKHGRCLKILKGHQSTVNTVCFTADGHTAVSGGGQNDHTLRIWDMLTGKNQKIIEVPEQEIQCLSITPDGSKAVTVSNNNIIRLWQLNKGICINHKRCTTIKKITDIQITHDGRKILYSSGYAMNLKNTDDFGFENYFYSPAQTALITSLRMTPDAKGIISAHNDNTIKVWRPDHISQELKAEHESSVEDLSLSSDGKWVISASTDFCLMYWNLEEGYGGGGHWEHVPCSHDDSVFGVCMTPDGKRIISGGLDQVLKIWDHLGLTCLDSWNTPSCIEGVSVSVQGRHIMTAHSDSMMRLWDIYNAECKKSFKGHTDCVNSICMTPDGRLAVSGSNDTTLKIWDLQTGDCLKTMMGHTGWIQSVCLSPDSKKIISSGYDKTLRIWEIKSGKCIQVLDTGTQVEAVSITPDGQFILSAGHDNVIQVWNMKNSMRVTVFKAQTPVNSLSEITAHGRFACGLESGKVLLFQAQFSINEPLVTPVRMWCYHKENNKEYWDDNITVICPWCGKRFPAPEKMLENIQCINKNTGLTAGTAPCLGLPDEAWEELVLLSECEHCKHHFQYNPFIADLT